MIGSAQHLMRGIKHRLLSLALIALLVQATLPYLLTTCPVYSGTAAHSASHAAMPADCPMLAGQVKAPAQPDQHPKPQNTALICPLCAVMSPLHSFIVAGLIALPPPPPVFTSQSLFSISFFELNKLPPTAGFSARAPPIAA